MAPIIVAGASGQHATVVYEAAILSGLEVSGFATIEDASAPPILDRLWLGRMDDIATPEIDRGTRFIVAAVPTRSAAG